MRTFRLSSAAIATSLAALSFALTAGTAFAGIGGSVVPDYPSPVTVGQTALPATLTITNSSTNNTENVAVSSITHSPSCATTASGTCSAADADTGVFTVHNGTGQAGTACAGVTFTAGAPDANGNLTFTPGSAIVLGPSSGTLAAAQCIIGFTVDVLKVPTKDASVAAGIQTDQLGSAQFLGQTSLLTGSGSGSTQTTVNKVTPTIATTLSTSTAPVGTAVHDSAILTGATSNAAGTVTYTAYTGGSCTTGAQSAGTKTVAGGIVPNSDPITFNTAGTFDWQAVYSGDANNAAATSTCLTETLTVNKAHPSIATTLSATSTTPGTAVHDSAALTGATATAGGSATYSVYTDNACTFGKQDAGTVTVANHLVPDSNPITFNTPGTFYWQVAYLGDAANSAATSTCQSEILTVGKVAPTIATTLSTSTAPVGTAVHDSSTLSGATSDAAGTVTYTAYTNNACSLGAQSAGTKTVATALVPNSDPITFNTAGTFYWQAVYSGDAKNLAATSTCGSEVLTVTPPPVVQYCSPGYWKQPQHFHSYVAPLTPTSQFDAVFGSTAFPGKTLVDVLSTGGGGLIAYGRATVGALLNAAALNSGLTTAQVISDFNATFAGAPSGNSNGYYGSANPQFTAPENCPLN
jgi:hypothetical protein